MRDVMHLAAIVAAIVLLAVGLYSVAREAGRLLQVSRAAVVQPADPGVAPVARDRPARAGALSLRP
jgi:hypothetical protein